MSRSDKIDDDNDDDGGFDTTDKFGIVTCVDCVIPANVTVTFGGEVISESLVGVIFFLDRAFCFFVAGSRRSSGGFPSSDGSKSLVFCTSNTVDGIIGSRFCAMPRILGTVDCGIDGSLCWS